MFLLRCKVDLGKQAEVNSKLVCASVLCNVLLVAGKPFSKPEDVAFSMHLRSFVYLSSFLSRSTIEDDIMSMSISFVF